MNRRSETKMALRAAAAAASVGRRRQLNSSLLSGIPVFLIINRHHVSLSNHTPVSSPQIQTWNKYSIRAIHEGATVAPMKREGDEEKSPQNWKVKMLYDGDCPLCMREVNMLKERDKRYEAIKFVDISSDEYSPEDNQGLDYEAAMGRIHAILSDGTIVQDVEAFRKLYEAVGLGWVYAITKYEPVATIAAFVYGVWAKYRLQITGRPPLEEVLEARKKKGETCNDSKACKM